MLDFSTQHEKAELYGEPLVRNIEMRTHTGPLFIFANKQQKQIGQTPHLKHEHFSKKVGAEEKSRNVFQYILTSGHEGTHSIPTEQMGALITRSIGLTLPVWLEDRLVLITPNAETLVSFARPLLPGSGSGASGSRANQQQHLDPNGPSYM